ncbi:MULTISPECIES: hypothetical protein [unclassified Actinomyces]|uniref:hypothetical protein n=1 Tax=unclassified Actinomyces TaxID=2609248 RepID=UPI001373CB8E|nr:MULTISPECIES: hypothetical protein [unclassified Actinomyces]MBW3069587.1 hypothetical protein [Actinomyces sp. 594]NDR53236.1 hypothetical protein [Actinomyces sp. 565]QHO90779.1 hypothetical protein CWT12_04820 [Actinomyces sp. 432]
MLRLICTLQVIAGDLTTTVRDRLNSHDGEKGASTVEWVIITGFLIVLAALVGRAVYSLVQDAASNLKAPGLG